MEVFCHCSSSRDRLRGVSYNETTDIKGLLLSYYCVILHLYLIIVLFWNVSDVSNTCTNNHLHYLIRKHQVSILALLEQKIGGNQANRIYRGLGFSDWHCQEAKGMSEGLWLFWHQNKVSIDVLLSHQQFIHVKARGADNNNFLLTYVYRNPNHRD